MMSYGSKNSYSDDFLTTLTRMIAKTTAIAKSTPAMIIRAVSLSASIMMTLGSSEVSFDGM